MHYGCATHQPTSPHATSILPGSCNRTWNSYRSGMRPTPQHHDSNTHLQKFSFLILLNIIKNGCQ